MAEESHCFRDFQNVIIHNKMKNPIAFPRACHAADFLISKYSKNREFHNPFISKQFTYHNSTFVWITDGKFAVEKPSKVEGKTSWETAHLSL